jgi:hypothetical protein
VLYRGQADYDWLLSSKWERELLRMKNKDRFLDHSAMFAKQDEDGVLAEQWLNAFKAHAIGVPGLSPLKLAVRTCDGHWHATMG